jgi:site-specific DNA-methyltransferase (adenine-specific)
LIYSLAPNSVGCVITSPPYGLQRQDWYDSVDPKDFPEFTVQWTDALMPKLTSRACVVIVVKAHIKKGVVDEYVSHTHLAMLKRGWVRPEEPIWYKRDAPGVGATKTRLRECWEHVLVYSRVRNPLINIKAMGKYSDRLGMPKSKYGNQKARMGTSENLYSGTARDTNVFEVTVNKNAEGINHPSQFPVELARRLILTYSDVGDLILDPFMGSGTTGLAAIQAGRRFVGFEIEEKFVDIANERIAELRRLMAANG